MPEFETRGMLLYPNPYEILRSCPSVDSRSRLCIGLKRSEYHCSVTVSGTKHELHRNHYEQHQASEYDKRYVVVAEKIVAKVSKRRSEREARRARRIEQSDYLIEILVAEQVAREQGQHNRLKR